MSGSSGGENGRMSAGLDAADRDLGYQNLLTVNLVTCSLSLAGSLVMIIPFFLSHQLRKVRHRLILGLAINDFVQAVTVLVPSIYVRAGGRLVNNSVGCKVNAFFYVSLVVAGCFWALAIAGTTYAILVHPLSLPARLLHHAWAMPAIWAVIWIISFFNASLGVALVPTRDVGGLCFFPGTPPALYGNLVLFIPRTLLFMIVIGLYVHLFRFFRRSAVKAKATETASFSSILPEGGAPVPTPVSFSSVNNYQFPPKPNSQLPENGDLSFISRGSLPEKSPVASSFSSSSSKLATAYQSIWGRKGSKDSETTLVNQFQGRPKPSQSPRKNRMGHSSPLDIPILENAEEPGSTELERVQSLQDSDAILSGSGGFESQLKMLESPLESARSPSKPQPTDHRVSFDTPPSFSRRAVPDTSAYRFPPHPIHLPPRDYTFPSSRPPISPGTMEPSVAKELEPAIQLQSQEARYQRVRQTSITDLQGGSIECQVADEESGSNTLDTIDTRETTGPAPKGGIMGFEEALQSVGTTPEHERKMSLSHDPSRLNQRRMSAAEESRRVSYLMMLYPAAYSLIVAISLARTLSIFITGSQADEVLNLLNRIFVLSPGFVDALIYTLIEWRFRAATRAASR